MQMTAGCSVASCFEPATSRRRLFYEVMLIIAGSATIAASAQLSMHLPFNVSRIPVTGQTFAVLLVGALFGSWRGALTVVAYLVEGASGLPVFAGGVGGMVFLFGPTAGYLIGFVPAAFVVGWFAERGWDRRPAWTAAAFTAGTAAAFTAGTAIIFLCGLIWLSMVVPLDHLLREGLIPFLPGAILKIMLATALLPVGWKILAALRF